MKFHPMLSCRETMAADLAIGRRTLVKRAKEEASRKDAERRGEELKALPQQGQMKRDCSQEAEQVWGSVVSNLSPEVMKFALNAATDTLPHNSNLAKWRKGSVSDVCKLCGGKQTLLHVLKIVLWISVSDVIIRDMIGCCPFWQIWRSLTFHLHLL